MTSRRTTTAWPLAVAALLALGATSCDPQLPSVVLLVDDGERDVAAGAVVLAVGPSLDDLREIPLDDAAFPVSITVVSTTRERSTLWVEARDAGGRALARATADEGPDAPGVRFTQREENVVNVTLLSACESGDETCDDGAFCNGVERCDGQVCRAGEAPCTPSPFSCVDIACLEDEEACDVVVSHNVCDPIALDGGVLEPTYCDVAEGCRPGQACFDDAECGDGLACNGDERCLAGRCIGGTPLPIDDANPCTVDACDEAADAVLNVPVAVGSACVLDATAGTLGLCLGGGCVASTCGDAYVDVEAGEACDDGNADDDDGCTAQCAASRFVLEAFAGGTLCDGMPLADASLGSLTRPRGTPAGGFTFLDGGRRVVRRWTPTPDAVERIVGSGVEGSPVDGEPASTAALAKSPSDLAVHPTTGAVFWVDSAGGPGRVYTVDEDGLVRVVAGSGGSGSAGAGSDARSYSLAAPSAVTVTSADRLIVVNGWGRDELYRVELSGPDAQRIFPVDDREGGAISDSGLASTLRFNDVRALAVAPDGGFYASLGSGGAVAWGIARFAPRPDGDYDVTRVAGQGGSCSGSPVDGASALATPVCGPAHVVADVLGHPLCFAFQSGHQVWCIDDGGVIRVGLGTGSAGTPLAAASPLGNPVGWVEGLARTGGGALFVVGHATQYGARYLARVAADASVVDLLVGDATLPGFCGMGGPASAADVSSPEDVDVLSSGEVFLTATYADGFVVDASGIVNASNPPGISQVAAGPSGQLVGLGDGSDVRLQTSLGGGAPRIAGGGTNTDDGAVGDDVRFLDPVDLAMPHDDEVFVLERAGQRLRRLVEGPSGWVVETITGTGVPDPNDQGGPALSSALAFPTSFAVAPQGEIAIVDGTGRIKIVAGGVVAILPLVPAATAVVYDAAALFVATEDHRVLRVPRRDGALHPEQAIVVVGNGDARFVPGEGVAASVVAPTRLALGVDGALFVLQHEAHRVARVRRVVELAP